MGILLSTIELSRKNYPNLLQGASAISQSTLFNKYYQPIKKVKEQYHRKPQVHHCQAAGEPGSDVTN